jgi:hypothetical protein
VNWTCPLDIAGHVQWIYWMDNPTLIGLSIQLSGEFQIGVKIREVSDLSDRGWKRERGLNQ